MTKLRVRTLIFLLAGIPVWAAAMFFGVLRPLHESARIRLCSECPPPARIPEPVSEEGQSRLGPAKPGEWRYGFHEEPQSFEEYAAGPVNRACIHRTTFYLQPLGGAGERYRETLERMRLYAEAFFGVPARVLGPIPVFEDTCEPERGQYDATRIIGHLTRRIPADALVYMGITEKDLFSKGLHFVFGEGSLYERCGIYSLTRYETEDVPLFTRRSLKLLSHEAGHILSIHHCVTWSCVMQGANSLEEEDGQPMHLCPVDLRKILWNGGMAREDRYRRLLGLYRQWGLAPEALWVTARLGSD
jgi:archaemetzincin